MKGVSEWISEWINVYAEHGRKSYLLVQMHNHLTIFAGTQYKIGNNKDDNDQNNNRHDDGHGKRGGFAGRGG